MVGGETSFRQTIILMTRQAPKGARTSQRRRLRKSSCRSTGDGVRAQDDQGTATGPAPPSREGDAWEHAPRLGRQPLVKWSILHGGERHRGTGRGGPTRNPAHLRGPKPGLGMHVLKYREGRGRDSGWCHLQEGDLLRAHHQPKDEDPGTGLGQLEGDRGPGGPRGEEPRTDRHLRVREELKAHFSW